MSHDTAANLATLRNRIATAATHAKRDPNEITLVAVSKTQSTARVSEAVADGQKDFGENYLQEALEKIAALRAHELVWHFIGPIQSNKTRDIATHFDWVHSVDRLKIARRLSDQRADDQPALNICLQVNISDESSKAGIAADEAADLAAEINALPRLSLRGLMAIPAPANSQDEQRRPFAALRKLNESLRGNGIDAQDLSMGMTDDLEAAIAEGATLIRVGTAIFGSRN